MTDLCESNGSSCETFVSDVRKIIHDSLYVQHHWQHDDLDDDDDRFGRFVRDKAYDTESTDYVNSLLDLVCDSEAKNGVVYFDQKKREVHKWETPRITPPIRPENGSEKVSTQHVYIRKDHNGEVMVTISTKAKDDSYLFTKNKC